jgi:hypothetical protein
MVPVPAIADMVADVVVFDDDRDPVGETHISIATGPPWSYTGEECPHGHHTHVRVEPEAA